MIYRLLDLETVTMAKYRFRKGNKKDKLDKALTKMNILPKKEEKEEYKPKLDLSYVFQRLQGISNPMSVQRGKLNIYYELRSILDLFEQDDDFMALVEQDVMNKEN